MAENDKKGFSGLDDLVPKKKIRAPSETKNTEDRKSKPKAVVEKPTRDATRSRSYKYPKDDPYAFPSFDKITKNQWILIGFGVLILWAMFSDDKPSNSSNYSSNNSSYSQYDTPAEPTNPPASANSNFHGYGAIYFDPQSDVFGWALGYQNVYEAEYAALDICHKRGAIGVCEKSYSGEAKCLAIANGLTKRAWALGETKAKAESLAIQTCREGVAETCIVPPEGSACAAW
jgi:hypothetical protein